MYHKNKLIFTGVYSRTSLPKIKDAASVINLDDYKPIETHWITFYLNADKVLIALELNILQKQK